MRKIAALVLFFCTVFVFSLFAQPAAPATWSVKQQPGKGGEIELLFTATIAPNWYMYSTEATGGPIPTSVSFAASNDFVVDGIFTELTPSESKLDEAFGIMVKVFHNTASFVQKIIPLTDKNFTVRGTITYQSCDGASCTFDEEDFELHIAGVGGASAASKKSASGGLWAFFFIALAAGLGAVLTPCVFPMIPMTVSFFISGSQNKRTVITRGLIFGISVTLIYTLIGVLAAVFKSVDATDTISSHWIPNLIFAVVFLAFALSFFGAFEIVLPSGLANKADQKAESSGYLGAFFVAVALVIVSFSCTGPFVGAILVESMRTGLGIKPILGMFGFGLALAFPFTLFAFSPSLMKKLPKSGGWLNMVKVVFAFVLLAFSLDYISAFGQYFGWNLISREVFIGVWMVCAVMLGAYFLGRLRFSHDSEVQFVSVPRLLLAIASFTFALYLLPGLFGAPLTTFSGIIPDPKGPSVFAARSHDENATTAYGMGLCGHAKYGHPTRQLPHGLLAYHDIPQAIECARQLNKPVLLSFKFDNCSVCKKMEATVWSDDRVLEILRNKVVIVTIYVDDNTELPKDEWVKSTLDGKVKKTLGRKMRDYQVTHFNVAAQPFYVLIGFDEQPLTTPVGESSVDEFLKFLNSGIDKFHAKQSAFTPQIKI